VAEGEGGMPALSLRLAAGTEYRLELSGSGRGRLELARHALSRCFALPVTLKPEGDAYSKAFVREGDAHWYAVDGDGGHPVSLLAVPSRQDMRLDALLFDEAGHLIKEGSHTAGGACLLDFAPEAGRRYRVRLTCPEGETGLYDLKLERLAGDALPERVTLSRRSMTVEGRDTVALTAEITPAGAAGTLHFNHDSVMDDQAFFALYGTKGILYLPDPNAFGGEVRFLPAGASFDDNPAAQVLDCPFDYSDNSRGLGPADMARAILDDRPHRASAEMACHVLEVVDAIAMTATDANDRPYEDQVIRSVRVDTHGVEYPVEKIEP
jgi:hypothetical protein